VNSRVWLVAGRFIHPKLYRNVLIHSLCMPVSVRGLPVVSEMVLASKAFTADVTLVGSFVCVCPFVNQQVVRLGEVSTAEFTDELPSTCTQLYFYSAIARNALSYNRFRPRVTH
jgi:hypothetical protein